jgi:oligopeptidase B
MKTNMGAGHGGKSGRWNSLYETAEEFSFILWQMGMDGGVDVGNGKKGG